MRTLIPLLLLGGCAHYWVPERSLDAYASLSRSERRAAVVPAQRADGRPVFIRARDARPLSETRGELRQVRVSRAKTSVGIVLLCEGLVLFTAGVAIAVTRNTRTCADDECAAPIDSAVGGTMGGMGGVEMMIGLGLTVSGAIHAEVPPGDRRLIYLP